MHARLSCGHRPLVLLFGAIGQVCCPPAWTSHSPQGQSGELTKGQADTAIGWSRGQQKRRNGGEATGQGGRDAAQCPPCPSSRLDLPSTLSSAFCLRLFIIHHVQALGTSPSPLILLRAEAAPSLSPTRIDAPFPRKGSEVGGGRFVRCPRLRSQTLGTNPCCGTQRTAINGCPPRGRELMGRRGWHPGHLYILWLPQPLAQSRNCMSVC